MSYLLGINLARPTSHSQIKGNAYFEYYIPLLQTMGFSVFRVVFTSWALNCHSIQNQQEILQLLKYCQQRNIKLILVLYHFTDFLDLSTKEYYHYENKNRCMTINRNTISTLISRIFEENLQHAIYRIELFNEIDLASPKKQKQILQDLNLLLIQLKKRFPLYYTISISNHLNKKAIQQQISCPLELHMYSYPHETVLGNIKYIQTNNLLQQIGEYAKYSDEHKSILSSYIYFTAGLWAGALLGRKLSPASRWREEIINDKKYQKVLALFQKIFPKLPPLINIQHLKIPFITQRSKSIIASPYSKIKTRLIGILQNIKILKYERGAFKKFLYKSCLPSPKSEFLVFCDHENKHYILVETYTSITIDLQQISHTQGYSIDLLTAKKSLLKNTASISISPGCYLFICGQNEKTSNSN